MRISDLARLAGVTVRTLRHYHQVHILPEPERDASNYRRYGSRHLIRVLRIKRLSELGFSLSSMGAILGKPGDAATDALAGLDRDLETQINRLTRQREHIAALIAAHSAPDTPVELASFHEVLSSAMPEDVREARREHLLLLAHLLGHEGLTAISDIYRNLTGPTNLAAIMDLESRFHKLDARSSDAALDQLADDFVRVLAGALPVRGSPNALELDRAGIRILNDHLLTITNSIQRMLINRIAKRLGA